MGDYNQYLWVKSNINEIRGSVLEIGSRFYDKATSINYRELISGNDYLGIDFQKGENVDAVVDITWSISKIREIIKRDRFDCIICNSVLEHVDDIFIAAQNITHLLSSNGVLFISVPFVWEEHGFPNDYWRFTPNGIKFLFPQLQFKNEKATISSENNGDISPLYKNSTALNDFVFRENIYQTNSNIHNKLIRKSSRFLKILSDSEFRFEYLNRVLFKKKNLMKKSCINMIGKKK